MRREEPLLGEAATLGGTHIYVCGLKGMEQGVDSALDDICRAPS